MSRNGVGYMQGNPGGIWVGWCGLLPEMGTRRYPEWLPFLSPRIQRTYGKFRQTDRANCGLLSEILIRYYLARIGISFGKSGIGHEESGKPHLPALAEISVSISHCRDRIAVTVMTRGGAIGIDLESVPRTGSEGSVQLPTSYLDPGERDWINSGSEGNRESRFLRVWCLKEAYGKALGTGIFPLLSQACMEWGSRSGPRIKAPWESRFRMLCPEWALALCWNSASQLGTAEIEEVKASDAVSWWNSETSGLSAFTEEGMEKEIPQWA